MRRRTRHRAMEGHVSRTRDTDPDQSHGGHRPAPDMGAAMIRKRGCHPSEDACQATNSDGRENHRGEAGLHDEEHAEDCTAPDHDHHETNQQPDSIRQSVPRSTLGARIRAIGEVKLEQTWQSHLPGYSANTYSWASESQGLPRPKVICPLVTSATHQKAVFTLAAPSSG